MCFTLFLCLIWFSSGNSGLLPQFKDKHMRLTHDFICKLSRGVNKAWLLYLLAPGSNCDYRRYTNPVTSFCSETLKLVALCRCFSEVWYLLGGCTLCHIEQDRGRRSKRHDQTLSNIRRRTPRWTAQKWTVGPHASFFRSAHFWFGSWR